MDALELVLGIDTSNYTTSLSAVSVDEGRVIADARRVLPVKEGERGLRQSDALFFHVQQLPDVTAELMRAIPTSDVSWRAVGVSVRPRPLASSYMPVFLAGTMFAQSFAGLNGIPVVRTSHQEGHLAAADFDLGLPKEAELLAVHLSGGTSDVLCVQRTRFGYLIETLGTGSDLNAGQFVDRVGVKLGMPFPAGAHLDRFLQEHSVSQAESQSVDAGNGDGSFRLSATVRGADLSFSGPCSAALRAIDAGVKSEVVTRAVFDCVAASLVKAIRHASSVRPQARTCVLAGGVMANTWIRRRVLHRLSIVNPNLTVLFAEPRLSSDNAVGVAHIARRFLRNN